jgi:hypothetical protein
MSRPQKGEKYSTHANGQVKALLYFAISFDTY